MSREIKFRIWLKKPKAMSPTATLSEMVNSFVATGVPMPKPSDHLVVMQYIGLKDKSGVEIYEGDIVQLKFRDSADKFSYEHGVVRWHEASAAFKWFAVIDDPSDGSNYWLSQADAEWRKVVGNIYENPKLLSSRDGDE